MVYEQNHFKNQIHICKEYKPQTILKMLEGVQQTQENKELIAKLENLSTENTNMENENEL